HGRRLGHSFLDRRKDAEVALAQHGHDPRDVMADLADLARVLQLSDGVLEPELVQLAARGAQAHAQLVLLQHSKLVDLHHLAPAASAAATNLVLIGSLAAASFMA